MKFNVCHKFQFEQTFIDSYRAVTVRLNVEWVSPGIELFQKKWRVLAWLKLELQHTLYLDREILLAKLSNKTQGVESWFLEFKDRPNDGC
jgi:hypothetical protein